MSSGQQDEKRPISSDGDYRVGTIFFLDGAREGSKSQRMSQLFVAYC